jgi:hypothetical protein
MSTSFPISGPYPGLTYNPALPESPFLYTEIREINQTMYFVINAYFDGTLWNQQNTLKASYAITQNSDNSFGHLSQPAGGASRRTYGGGERGWWNCMDTVGPVSN